MSREERKACCVSTWQLPATESFRQIHLARSDMKSKLQVLGSLGMPKPTDRQQKESATETTTAQPSSMVRRGGTGKSERGGREGVSPRFRASLNRLHRSSSSWQWQDVIFSPVTPSPSLLPAAQFATKAPLQHKQHHKFFIPAVKAPSQAPSPLPLLSPHDWSPTLTEPSPSTGDK